MNKDSVWEYLLIYICKFNENDLNQIEQEIFDYKCVADKLFNLQRVKLRQ